MAINILFLFAGFLLAVILIGAYSIMQISSKISREEEKEEFNKKYNLGKDIMKDDN